MPRLVVPVPTSGLPAPPHRAIDPLCNFENNITSATFLIRFFSKLETDLTCTSCASAEFLPSGTSDGTGPAKLSIHFMILKITSRTLSSSIFHLFFLQNSLHLLRPKHHLKRNVSSDKICYLVHNKIIPHLSETIQCSRAGNHNIVEVIWTSQYIYWTRWRHLHVEQAICQFANEAYQAATWRNALWSCQDISFEIRGR